MMMYIHIQYIFTWFILSGIDILCNMVVNILYSGKCIHIIIKTKVIFGHPCVSNSVLV